MINRTDHFHKSTLKEIKSCITCDHQFSLFNKLKRFFLFDYDGYNECSNCNLKYSFFGEAPYKQEDLKNKLRYIEYTFFCDGKQFDIIFVPEHKDPLIKPYGSSNSIYCLLPISFINAFSNHQKKKTISKFIDSILILK